MKLIRCLTLYPLMLGLSLITTISIAQQTQDEMTSVVPVEQNSIPEPDAAYSATNPEDAASANAPTTSRFSPTEKILADDAVSFPIDI